MLTKLRPTIQPILEIIGKPLLGINPNIISWIALLFPILFFISLIYQQPVLAFICLLLTPLDALDGYVAKKTGKVTHYGEMLDASLDRISDSLIIAAFAAAGVVAWPLVTLNLAVNLLISYIRAKAELASKAKIKMEEGLIERPDRLIILGAALLAHILVPNLTLYDFSIPTIIFWLLAILGIFTVYQRFTLAKKLLDK
jgi:archaetidylinositol phosphate synthase